MILEERVRKVDVEKMSVEQADLVQKELSAKMNDIIQKAITEANKYLNIYGMSAKMAFQINKTGEETQQAAPKTKKSRKKAQGTK
jgi:hypothetical protein